MMNLFDIVPTERETKYTTKVEIPQYLPSSICPSLSQLYGDKKYKQLIHEIEINDTITHEQKEFLKLAATRHIAFRYDKIADYYAHQSKEMQELMEKSALVILDFNDAIANGYVKLSKEIERIREQSGQIKEYDD